MPNPQDGRQTEFQPKIESQQAAVDMVWEKGKALKTLLESDMVNE